MSQAVRFQEVLRKLAIIDERCVADQAGLSLALPTSGLLDAKTAALVQIGALAAIGSPAVCLEWGTTQALAAGATGDEITGGYSWSSARRPGSAGSPVPSPTSRPRSDLTSRPRCWSRWCTLPGPH